MDSGLPQSMSKPSDFLPINCPAGRAPPSPRGVAALQDNKTSRTYSNPAQWLRRREGRCSSGTNMAAAGAGKVVAAAVGTVVKPIFSRDLNEARRRVRELYRAWYREVPNTGEGRGGVKVTGGRGSLKEQRRRLRRGPASCAPPHRGCGASTLAALGIT